MNRENFRLHVFAICESLCSPKSGGKEVSTQKSTFVYHAFSGVEAGVSAPVSNDVKRTISHVPITFFFPPRHLFFFFFRYMFVSCVSAPRRRVELFFCRVYPTCAKSTVSFLQSSDSRSWRRMLLLLCIEGKPTGASGLFRSIQLHILRASPLSVFTCLGVSPACIGASASCKAVRGISFRV